MTQVQTQARPAPTTAPATAGAATLLQRKCACGGSAGLSGQCDECQKKKLSEGDGARIQTKLAISAPGDQYEQEADRVAAQVLRAQGARNGESSDGRVLRRPGHTVNSEETCDVPPIVDGVLQSPGEPLDFEIRGFFEPRFGHDFGSIRVHDDARAAESARAVNAKAYTVGHHIVFDAGEYAPKTAAGRWLLAHELTHTVQQGAASVRQDAAGRGSVPTITRSAEPQLSRWKIEGTEAVADKDGESLKHLARSVGAASESWRCIRPMEMALAKVEPPDQPLDFNERYDRYVSATDRFDLSNLLTSTGPSVSLHILKGPKAPRYIGLFELLYPGLSFSPYPDMAIKQKSNGGLTPIKQLVLVGHADGSMMIGDPDDRKDAGVYSPAEVEKTVPDPRPSYDSTAIGEQSARAGAEGNAVPTLPRRCWFTRDASVRAVGCDSADFGVSFARAYLRKGAHVQATTASVRGVCETEQCDTLSGLDFAVDWDTESQRLEGPFYNIADFHAGSYWATLAYRGSRGWGIVRGKEGPGQRPASAVLGETGEQQIAAIRELLSTAVSDQEVRDVLRIFRSWGDQDRVTSAWPLILIGDDERLPRFLNNLEIEHFVEFSPEVLASLAALDDATRNRKIRGKTRDITSRLEAAKAFFLVMDLDTADADEMEALLGRREAPADRRRSRIIDKIEAALPLEVRVALVEALADERAREEQGLPAESDAFSIVSGEFSQEAAAEVIRQIDERLGARVLAFSGRAGGPEKAVPSAEFIYVAVKWLADQDKIHATAEVREQVGNDALFDAWLKWLNPETAQADYIKDVKSEKYQLALTEVLAHAVTPSSDLIVNSLSGGHISQKDARNAFGAFACLLGLPSNEGDHGDAVCTGEVSHRPLVRGTIQRLEEMQVLSPWLERLFRSADIDYTNPTNAAVLKGVLAERLPALAMSHVMALLKASEKNPRVPPEDALLAKFVIEAQPPSVQEAMRRELALHANGDLTVRLASQVGAEAAGVVVDDDEDESLATLITGIDSGGESAVDLLAALTSQPDMAENTAELDRLGEIDRLLSLFVSQGATPDTEQLRRLLAARDPLFSIGTFWRLLDRKHPPEPAVRIAYEIQRALPADERALLLQRDATLWDRLTSNLPADLIADPTFGPPVDLGAQRDFLRGLLEDSSLWVVGPDGQLSPTLRTTLRLAIQAGIGAEMTDLVGMHWNEALSPGLSELGYQRNASGGSIGFHPRAEEPPDIGRGLSLPTFVHLGLGWLFSGPVTVPADRLVETLTNGTGVELDVEPRSKKKDAQGHRPGTVTIDWLNGGILQVVGSDLVLERSDSLFPGAVVRTGGGRLRGLEIRYKWNEKKNPDDLSSLTVDAIELTDIAIATEDAVYGLGRILLTGVAATGDLATGRPFYPYPLGPRMHAMSDLLFSIYDGLFAIVALVQERLMLGGDVEGAEELASAIAARFEQRLSLGLRLDTVLLEGLVVPGKVAVDRVTLGRTSELDPRLPGVILSVTSSMDWDRLEDLRARSSAGEALSAAETEDLTRLTRESLGLAVGLDLRTIDVKGVRTVALDESGKLKLRMNLEQFKAERIGLEARISATPEGQEIPSELAALAAMDSGILDARLETLTAFVEAPTVVPGAGVTIPGLGDVGDGSLGAARLELAVGPDGSLHLTVLDSLVQGVQFESPLLGTRLVIQEVRVGQALVQQLRTSEGADNVPAVAGFPRPEPGDTLLRLQDLEVGGVLLTIDDLGMLAANIGAVIGASAEGAEGVPTEDFWKLLYGVGGRMRLSVSARIRLGPDRAPLRPTLYVPVEISEGKILADLTPETLLGVMNVGELIKAKTGITPGVKVPIIDVEKRLRSRNTSSEGVGKRLSDALNELEAATGLERDSIIEKVKTLVVDAAVFTNFELTTEHMAWRPDEVAMGDIVNLSLQWDQGQGVPFSLRIAPQGYLTGTGALVVRPFELAKLFGTVAGAPVLALRLALDRDVKMSAAATLDPKTWLPVGGDAEVPLSGVSLDELRVILTPGTKKKDKDTQDGHLQ